MRVERVEAFFLRYTYPDHLRYRFAGGRVENIDAAIVRVTSESGGYGIGELTFGQFVYEGVVGLVQHFDRLLKGHPIVEVTRAWELMYNSSVFWNRQGIGIAVMGAINMALYDLLGKSKGVPVHELLGGAARSRARIYASNGLFDSPEQLAADVKRARDAGFRDYKLRVISTETIIEHVTAFRDTVGSSMNLMVDAVQGGCAVPWSQAVARKLAHDLEPFAPQWLEEPVRVENIDGYVDVRRNSRVNIAGAESIPTAHAFRPYLERGAFDILQFDIATAGFTEGMRIGHLAAVHQIPVALHSWGTIVSIMAGVHLALAMPNCAITEHNFTEHPLNDQLLAQPIRIEDGHLVAPAVPGLGLKFDPSLAQKYPYKITPNTMTSTDEKDIQLV